MNTRTQAARPISPNRTRRIAVALQGGGSHGAFTWGVLDRLLQEPGLEIVGISGTSAGAMNAGILADALLRGGPEEARAALARYWNDVGRLPGYARIAPTVVPGAKHWHLDDNPLFLWHDMLTRIWSPYQTNPLNYNPLRRLLERINFARLRGDSRSARIYITATNVRTGLRRVFENEDLSADVLLASAALPQVYQAVEIDGEHYWDGGYTGNPALAPLYLHTPASDLIVVGINPTERPEVPKTARAIIDRIDEISFNSTFLAELAAIEFVRNLPRAGSRSGNPKRLFIHGIGDHALGSFGATSKLNNDLDFLRHLHAIGTGAADRWLATNHGALGRRSTVDLSGLAPTRHGALVAPSIIRPRQEVNQ